MVEIIELKAASLASYKAFLTPGLTDDEERFRITPEDDRDAPFPTVGAADSFTLGAFIDGKLSGVVSFMREGANRVKLRHKGLLFRMYVSPDTRGKGVGRELVSTLIDRVRRDTDIEQINLTVIANNTGAKALYERFGFVIFSTEERAVKWKGKYFSENTMALRLQR